MSGKQCYFNYPTLKLSPSSETVSTASKFHPEVSLVGIGVSSSLRADPLQPYFCPIPTQLFCVFQALLNIFSLHKGIRKPYTPYFSKYTTNFSCFLCIQKQTQQKQYPFTLLPERGRAMCWLQELGQASNAGTDKSWKHLGTLQLLNLQLQDLNTSVVNTSSWKIPVA